MSSRLIKYAFTAGIVSRELWSQTVLQKYGYGLADSRNFVTRFSGSIVSRGGLHAGPPIQELTGPFRFIPFTFAREDANNFSLLFTPNKLRFLQNGVYVLQNIFPAPATAVSSTATSSTITVNNTGPVVVAGDLVELYGANVPATFVGQTVEVLSATATTVTVKQIGLNLGLDNWNATASFTLQKVYTLATPFTGAMLPSLYFKQSRDIVRITTQDLPPYTLVRNSNGTWTLSETVFGASANRPTGATITPSAAGSSGYVFRVTAVFPSGEESLPSDPAFTVTSIDYTATAGHATFSWSPVAGAVSYNIYRSTVAPDAAGTGKLHLGFDLGFLGSSLGTSFTDRNIIPDFTRTFPTARNPFGRGVIERFTITNGGTGHTLAATTLSITDPTGSGAILTPIVIDGVIVAVTIIDGGKNYTAPTVNIGGPGVGTVITANLSPATGNFPAVSGIHNQRQVYSNWGLRPLAISGSVIGQFNNFNFSRLVIASDAYTYELSSETQGFVKHLVSTRVGLVAFSDLGVWVVRGSNGAISPTDVQAELQTAVGCSKLFPLLVDADLVYAETDSQTIRLLQYNDFSKNFAGSDVSVLARALIASPRTLLAWTYESRPYKLVWAVRDDGRVLSFTISQEEKVYAWNVHETGGEFLDCHTLYESTRETTYFVVSRYRQGIWRRHIEPISDRERTNNFTHVGVDSACGFGLETVASAALIVPFLTAEDQIVTFTTTAAVFSAGDVGKLISHEEGRAYITQYLTPTSVLARIFNDFAHLNIPYLNARKQAAAGTWRLTAYRTSYQLPLNARPDGVTVCADGKVFIDTAVGEYGVVTFLEPLAYGYVGQNFNCMALTLPFTADGTIIEDSRNNVKGVGLRFVRTRGLNVGVYNEENVFETETFPIEQKLTTIFSEAQMRRSDHDYVPVSSDWEESNQILMESNGADTVEITGLIKEIEVGDEVG